MAQATNLTLVGTAPASTTWTLMSRDAQSATWQDRRRGIVSLFGTIKMRVYAIRDQANNKLTGKYSVSFKYIEPTVRTVNGIEVTVDPIVIDVAARISGDATDAEKAHALKIGQSMLAHAIYGASYTTGESLT